MIKQIIGVFIFIISCTCFAQNFSALWEGYFSYFDIVDVTQGDNKIFAASENAVFSYDINTNELTTITTIDGLSGESISTLAYSDAYQLLLIGYESGLMEIAFENNDILTVVDIINKESIPPSDKKINHFNIHNELVYMSTDFGITVYDLERLEFGDTYFIGTGGSQIIVNQTDVVGDFIYVACSDNNGLKKAMLSNPNLIDYQQWLTISTGNFISAQEVENKLFTIRSNGVIYEVINDVLNQLFTYTNIPVDIKSVNNNLIVTTNNNVFVYNSNYNLLSNATVNIDFETQFTSATISDDAIYIGTNSLGVLQTILSQPIDYQIIKPDGPLMNNAFKIETDNRGIWLTYGDYSVSYNPSPLRSFGISHLIDDTWINIPFDSLLNARDLNYISVNPFNTNQTFISSCHDGLLELNNDEAIILYNQTNSELEPLFDPDNPNAISIRQTGSTFDANGILWAMTCRVDSPLKSYDPNTGQWQAYSFTEIIEDGFVDEFGFSDIVIDNNGIKWLGSYHNGVIGYNENSSDLINRVYTEEQNMPSTQVRAVAIDNSSQLWIGTISGLRVLFNTSGFLDDPDPSVNEIVILDDGIPQELLSNQFITDIKVDGSNNKWVGTLTSGVFYFSPNGQETIYHFTTDNSPLPSNNINDISIDSQNGKVYFATTRGLVSFSLGGSDPKDKLSDVFVYPNPVRPEYNILGANDLNNINNGVKVSGLTENVNIKITDIEGNLVAEAQSRVNLRSSRANYNFAIDGGTAIWNGKNLANNIVASGVYLILISDLDSFETKVLKLLIIR